jgi:hypothetical protein
VLDLDHARLDQVEAVEEALDLRAVAEGPLLRTPRPAP